MTEFDSDRENGHDGRTDTELSDRDAVDATPRVVAADGGSAEWTERADALADEGAEILDDGGAEWLGPFTEYDKYGRPTGAEYVRCSECRVEVLDGEENHATHRDDCPEADR